MQQSAAPDLVGVGDARPDQRLDPVDVLAHERLEIGKRIFARGRNRAADRGIEPLQRIVGAAQQQEMHRAQDQVGVRLSRLRMRRQCLEFRILSDALGEARIQ
jgi:hypothetical protein